ncbi:MAG: beta-ketoacyl-ACP synthase 3 [bacterium]|nr:beta-ketoacyl-ACP synthase 3 [bacterium]
MLALAKELDSLGKAETYSLRTARIIGTGSFVPPYEVDNKMISSMYTSRDPGWIESRTGIHARRHGFNYETMTMRDGYYDNDIAEKAAKSALDNAGITAKELDMIIRVTCTPEYLFFPDAGCVMHERLEASNDCAALTIPAGCGGLVYALKVVEGMIKGGSVNKVLIVASNSVSSYIDFDQKERDSLNAYIFGDGAGAVVMQGEDSSNGKLNTPGIIASYWGADRYRDPMLYPAGGSRNPTRISNVEDHWYKMDAKAVRVEAPKLMLRAIGGLQKACPFLLHEVDWFLFHQANLRILEDLSKKAEIPMEKILINLDKYGNTSAASIAILLDEAVREGKIKRGDLLLLSAVGAGWQYGSFLIRW